MQHVEQLQSVIRAKAHKILIGTIRNETKYQKKDSEQEAVQCHLFN